MERRKSELLDSVLMRFMRENGLETPLNEYRLIQAWPAVVGSARSSASEALYIRNQTLYVRVGSPALRANLAMERHILVQKLNQTIHTGVITDIAFV